jgi:hypothetical protein
MAEEWTQWFSHDGSGVPEFVIGKLIEVEAVNANGNIHVQSGVPTEADAREAKHWDWSYHRVWSERYGWHWSKVLRYRIYRPSALRDLIDLAENTEHLSPETVTALVGV